MMKTTMIYRKSTKNTYVFDAASWDRQSLTAPIPTLYVSKDTFEAQPAKIEVTIEVIE